MHECPCISVLSEPHVNVGTKPRMQCHGDGETEPTENLHQLFCFFWCRKVIMHECPCLNLLSVAMLEC